MTSPPRASTPSRTISAKAAANRAAASSPWAWVNAVYPLTSAMRNVRMRGEGSPAMVRPDISARLTSVAACMGWRGQTAWVPFPSEG